jgi:hypothetical protein
MTLQPGDYADNQERSANRPKNPPIIAKISGYILLSELALPFVAVLGFLFDREISNVLYEWGVDPTKLTSLFFLQYRYSYFLTKITSANLHHYDFLMFEIFAWLAIFIGAARLATALVLIDYFDARMDIRKVFSISGVAFFFGWLFVVPAGIFASMDARIFGSSSSIVRSLMVYSPRIFLCVQTVTFCWGSCFFFEGLWLMLQLAVAVWRRGSSVRPGNA